MIKRTLIAAFLAASLTAGSTTPALADGAASTRNILIGGAAAAAGTLLIINHNKQVHQRYADDARRQASTQAQANNAQAAYTAERRAYENEVAINGEYKREVATQHALIVSLRNSVATQKARADRAVAQAHATVPAASAPVGVGVAKAAPAGEQPLRVASASWGWGRL